MKLLAVSLLAIVHCCGIVIYADEPSQDKQRRSSELETHDLEHKDSEAFRSTGLVQREKTTGVMGTELKLTAIGSHPELLDQAINAAIDEIQRVEDLMTDWRPSPLTRLNESAGSGPRKVPEELAVIVAHGVEMGRLTQGAFDITYAGVGQLWNFKKQPFTIPNRVAIQRALRDVGHQHVKVDLKAFTVDLLEGTKIGLGGIAKGYGVDRAMAVLMELGVKHAVVDAGGDMKILGKNFGEPWEIGIKHPRERQRAMASIRVSNTCVVTSGDYERFFEINGKRYHHIIDPRTGYPSQGCLSATVIAPEAEFADSLATALCVLGPKKGLGIVESIDRVEAILVDMDGVVVASTGLKNAIK